MFKKEGPIWTKYNTLSLLIEWRVWLCDNSWQAWHIINTVTAEFRMHLVQDKVITDTNDWCNALLLHQQKYFPGMTCERFSLIFDRNESEKVQWIWCKRTPWNNFSLQELKADLNVLTCKQIQKFMNMMQKTHMEFQCFSAAFNGDPFKIL